MSNVTPHVLLKFTAPESSHYPEMRIMDISAPARHELDGAKQYKAVIRNPDGSPASSTEFADWFANDEAARVGFAEILREQGYEAASVEIGFPCVVTLK